MVLFIFTEDSSNQSLAAGSICCYSWRQWRSNNMMFVTSPNRIPSCPNFRFPPTSANLLTILDIRTCLYRVTFKTWAGPGWFYTAREVLGQIKSVPSDSYLGFLGDLENKCVFKRCNSLWFCKNLYVSIHFITKYRKWRTFSGFYFQFAKLPSWFKACSLLWKEIKTTKNLLPKRCRPLPNNIPSLSLNGPKNIGDLKCWWISFVLFLANF